MSNTPLLVTYQVWTSPRVAWTGINGERLQSEWLHDARSYAEKHGNGKIKIEFRKEERRALGQKATSTLYRPTDQDRRLTQVMLREVAENSYSRDARCRSLAAAATGVKRPFLNVTERSVLRSWPVKGLEIQSVDRALIFDPRLYQKTPAQHTAVISLIRQGRLIVSRVDGRLWILSIEDQQ